MTVCPFDWRSQARSINALLAPRPQILFLFEVRISWCTVVVVASFCTGWFSVHMLSWLKLGTPPGPAPSPLLCKGFFVVLVSTNAERRESTVMLQRARRVLVSIVWSSARCEAYHFSPELWILLFEFIRFGIVTLLTASTTCYSFGR